MIECSVHPGKYVRKGYTCAMCNHTARREEAEAHRRKEAEREAAPLDAAQAKQ